MPSVEIVSTEWPIVFVKMEGAQNLADFEQWIEAFNRFYERKEKFSCISYMKTYTTSAEVIGRVGRWWRETEPLIKQYFVSNAIITHSTGFRFLLSAVYLIKPLPIPNRVCATPDEAISFTRAQWRDRILPAPKWPF